MSSDLTIVEVAGPPGAGKTTVARALVEQLRAEGHAATTIEAAARQHAARTTAGRLVERVPHERVRRLLLWYCFYLASTARGLAFAARHRPFTRHVIRALGARRRAGDAVGRTHTAFWLVQLAGRLAFLMSTAPEGEIVVLDDGFLHRSVHLHASTRGTIDRGAVREYVSLAPRADLVACLDVPADTCLPRVLERGVWKHARELDEASLRDYLRSARAVTEVARRRADELGWPVVTITNDSRDASATVREVQDTLDRLPRPAQTEARTRERTVVPHVPRPARVRALAAGRFGTPVLSPARVRAVLDHYDLAADASEPRDLRVGRRSLNAAVVTHDGVKVVKQYRPHWTEALVAHGHSILVRLEQRGFPAVRLTRAPEGPAHVVIDGCVYSVFDFVEGESYSLHFLRRSDRLALTATAGTTLARMHECLADFVPHGHHHLGFADHTGPPVRDVAWYERTVGDLSTRSVPGLSAATVEPLRRLRDRADAAVARIGVLDRELDTVELPRLVAHGDYGLHNLVFPSTTSAVVVDFESARLDWRINDLVSALGKYRARRNRRYDVAVMETFLRAYAARFPLLTEELEVLPEVWELYRLRAAVQYWSSYWETGGPVRKLWSAVDALEQAEWAATRPALVAHLAEVAGIARQERAS